MGENLFEEEFTIEALSQMGNPLDRLAALVDFDMYRLTITSRSLSPARDNCIHTCQIVKNDMSMSG